MGSTRGGPGSTGWGCAIKEPPPAAEPERPDVALARTWWRRPQSGWDQRRLVFIDETALNPKRARLYGRRLRGPRCVGAVPPGPGQTAPFSAALRFARSDAPFRIAGAAKTAVFSGQVRQVLCPELEAGEIVIRDNRCRHKTAPVGELISARGASGRGLPASSPDLNPIEPAVAKLKAHRRQAAARTLDDRQAARTPSLAHSAPEHGRGFFRPAPYASI